MYWYIIATYDFLTCTQSFYKSGNLLLNVYIAIYIWIQWNFCCIITNIDPQQTDRFSSFLSIEQRKPIAFAVNHSYTILIDCIELTADSFVIKTFCNLNVTTLWTVNSKMINVKLYKRTAHSRTIMISEKLVGNLHAFVFCVAQLYRFTWLHYIMFWRLIAKKIIARCQFSVVYRF